MLAKFATDGKFVSDLSITEEEFLREAVAAEQERSIVAEQPKGSVAAEQPKGVIVAETINGEQYCRGCGMHLTDYGCVCE